MPLHKQIVKCLYLFYIQFLLSTLLLLFKTFSCSLNQSLSFYTGHMASPYPHLPYSDRCSWSQLRWRLVQLTTFIHSIILDISIAPLQVHCYSEVLPTQHGYCVRVSRQSATWNCEVRTCPRSLRGG